MLNNQERTCTAHFATSYEAEVVECGMTYLMLRCPTCDRPQGMRLVRKPRPVTVIASSHRFGVNK